MSAVYAEPDTGYGSRLSWVIVASAVVLVIVILVLGHQSFMTTERAAVEEFNQRQLTLASGATHGIELYFDTLSMGLRAMAADPAIQGLEEGPTRRALELECQKLKALGVWDVGVIDAAGVLRYSAIDAPVEGTDFSGRDYFREAREATSSEARIVQFVEFAGVKPNWKGLLVGVPIFGPPAGVAAGAPGRFLGLVATLVKLDFLAGEFVEPIRPSEGGHAFLVDHQGTILWSPDPSLMGTNVLAEGASPATYQEVIRTMLAGKPGTRAFRGPRFDEAAGRYTDEMEDRLIAYMPVRVGREPWAIGVWAPEADARRLIRGAYNRQILVMVLGTLVVLVGTLSALGVLSRVGKVLERKVQAKTRELEESHERLLTVLDGLDAIVCVSDLDTGEVRFVNRLGREVFGDTVGKTCWETMGSDQSEARQFCGRQRLLDAGGDPTDPSTWELESTRNGRWYQVEARAIRWTDGSYVRLVIAFDITDRREQEQLIVDQNVRLRQTQGEIESSRHELALATAKVSELIDTAAVEQSFDTQFDNENLVTCWRARSCSNTWCPVHGREGVRCWQVEGTYCDRETPLTFAEKVEQCRQCEIFRQSCPNRLTELAEGFNNMMFLLRRKAEELKQLRYHALQRERMATIGQMAAGIAHEIDNPLASLFSLVQVLKASTQEKETRARIALMQQCVDRISKIVREVVDFGRPVGKEDWTYGDVEKSVVDTLNLLRYDRRARKADITVDFEPGLPRTLIIEHQLQQVFMNIMINALDAMHGRGKLGIRGGRADGFIEIAISDTGEGMDPEQMKHIFEPFYTTKAGRKGSGLGLALSYNILHRHEGTIRVESEKGKGSTFTISIPIREPNGDPHAASQNPGR